MRRIIFPPRFPKKIRTFITFEGETTSQLQLVAPLPYWKTNHSTQECQEKRIFIISIAHIGTHLRHSSLPATDISQTKRDSVAAKAPLTGTPRGENIRLQRDK